MQYLEESKRFGFIRVLIPRRAKKRAQQYTKYEKIRLVCEELGPTFIKFGQILSNRPDLIPLELIDEFEKLQDNVPPMSEKEAKYAVENELKDSVENLFAWFETAPFASASMAQVHKATLHTGERVALKVQRPGIQEVIVEDIKVMYQVAAVLLKRVPSIKSFDPIGLVKNFEESILKELDFINESINVQRFNLNLTTDGSVDQYARAPKVFPKYTTAKLLTLEFMNGTKISKITEYEEKGLDRKEIAKRLAISYYKQIFDYGFFHADPHPGNLLVLPSGKICYLDFGMMGSILPRDIELFGQLFISITNRDVKKIIKVLQQLSDNAPINNMRALEFDLNEFVQRYYVRSVNETELSKLMLELKDIIVQHDLTVPSHFFLFIRSLVTVEGVIYKLDPELSQFGLVRPYLVRAVAKKFSPIKMGKKVLNSLYEINNYMEEFPRDLKNAIRKINRGEIKVDINHTGIDPMVHTIHRVSKQLASAFIICSLVIAGAMFTVSDIGVRWWNTSAVGLICFGIAFIIAFGMLRNYRKGDRDDWQGWKHLK
ncbi:AarF/ABC1/UbiB kinase family protein [Paracrocinitomix mangrovi]|uniref:ABC1 kinase family protein n=1 Tax=Paracrocinitomix mangrovi TaxID=2862509 RepID=UPI001ED9D037|nr:AarF/ABC1/UbiB kinase family protein [Paracrocinitomix mangrovi]UKN03147.1 AarF/ABC1/UbiB kinase family protein [Paracrocinitomix mangrovi]